MALKASPEAQASLLQLQASDNRLQQLDHKARMLPEAELVAGLTKESEGLRQQLLAETGAIEDARLELGRVESDVAVVEARIVRDTDRVASSASVKDVAGLEHELESLRRRRDDLEEIQLGVMERLDELESIAAITRERYEELAASIAAAEAERDASLGAITAERTAAAANRVAIAGGLPDDLLALYERQRGRYGQGASHLRFGVSAASGVKLNENDMAAIRSAAPDDVVLCPDSQAILVRTDESGL